MTSKVSPEKKVDLPPTGSRNPDPISKAPGAHPIEAGVGAAVVGAAAGAGAGAVAGPVGAAIGAVVGGVAGGYAGKAVGEMIDPTTDDSWLRDNFASRPYVKRGDTYESYQPAYSYGGEAECQHGDCGFEQIENDLEHDWNARAGEPSMPWSRARSAVKDGYDRTVQIRRARDVPEVLDEELED
jgi:hypothetical protein